MRWRKSYVAQYRELRNCTLCSHPMFGIMSILSIFFSDFPISSLHFQSSAGKSTLENHMSLAPCAVYL